MRAVALVVASLCLLALVSGQQSQWDPSQPESWNELFVRREGQFLPNPFVEEVIKDLTPGRALDISMGQGRNALFLAEHWQVTGFDFSDMAVEQAQRAASARGLLLNATVANVSTFDYGVKQWDLVLGIYIHGLLTANPARVMASLKPGGVLVVEGFHRELVPFGYESNELLTTFDDLEILRYEDAVGMPDSTWAAASEFRFVRLVARKP